MHHGLSPKIPGYKKGIFGKDPEKANEMLGRWVANKNAYQMDIPSSSSEISCNIAQGDESKMLMEI